MSNAKVRARRRRRGNRAWTAAMTPVELHLTPEQPAPALCEYVAHSCHVLKNGAPHLAWEKACRVDVVRGAGSQPNVQNLKPRNGEKADAT
jgi:hypothetical protein